MRRFLIFLAILLIKTGRGTAVITGCAHPGLVQITGKAQEILPGRISSEAVPDVCLSLNRLRIEKKTGDIRIRS